MSMLFPTSLLAFVLTFVAWMMHVHHQQTVKEVELHPEWDPQKRGYLLAQVRRRKKVTYTLMLIAIAVLISPAIPHNAAFIAYWAVVLLLVLWMVVLAGLDGFATKSYLLSLRDQRIASRRALEEEVKRLREENRSAGSSAEE